MKFSPRVCTSEVLISYSRNEMCSVSDSADAFLLLRYQRLRDPEREPQLKITLCVIYPHFSLILHCLALCYYLCLCAMRPKHVLDGPSDLGMS